MREIMEILERCWEYFDDRQDIDNNGNANDEMRLKMDVERVMEILKPKKVINVVYSDCCGSPVMGDSTDYICSECKEHCSSEEDIEVSN